MKPLFSASCAPQSSGKEGPSLPAVLSWPPGSARNLRPRLGLVPSKPERCLPPGWRLKLGVTSHRCLAPHPPAPVRTPWHPWLPSPHPPCQATRSPLPLSSPAPLPLPLLPPEITAASTPPPGDPQQPTPVPPAHGQGVVFHPLQAPLVMLRRQMTSDLVTRTAAPCAPHQPSPQTPAGGLCPSQGFSLSLLAVTPALTLEGRAEGRGHCP